MHAAACCHGYSQTSHPFHQKFSPPFCIPQPARPMAAVAYSREALDVAFDAPDASELIVSKLRQWGVVVLTGVLDDATCDARAAGIVHSLESLSDGASHKDLDTWTPERLLPQTRFGMFQSRLGNVAEVWSVRAHPRVRAVFAATYSGLRGKRITDFVTSIDGVNVRPPVAPFFSTREKDWAHFDLTRDAHEETIQGQVVLTTTTAGFRCSPRSHLLHTDLVMEQLGTLSNPTDWLPLPLEKYADVQARVEALGGAFQVPIVAPKGSMILWLSSTLHSAKPQDKPPRRVRAPRDDPLRDWRVVVYVCYRPCEEVDDAHIARLQTAFRTSVLTNHSGNKLFPRGGPGGRGGPSFTPKVARILSGTGDTLDLAPPLSEEISALISRPRADA